MYQGRRESEGGTNVFPESRRIAILNNRPERKL